jgi:hypothetical protein
VTVETTADGHTSYTLSSMSPAPSAKAAHWAASLPGRSSSSLSKDDPAPPATSAAAGLAALLAAAGTAGGKEGRGVEQPVRVVKALNNLSAYSLIHGGG